MKISTYSDAHRVDLIKLISLLQDHEESLSTDRASSADIATDQFDYVLKDCRRSDGEVYIAIVGLAVVGFIAIGVEREESLHVLPEYKASGFIWDLAVLSEYHSMGVASALVDKAQQHFKSINLNRMKISFLSNNHGAEAAYRKIGFDPYETIYEKRF